MTPTPRIGYGFRRIGAVQAADIDRAKWAGLSEAEVQHEIDQLRVEAARHNLAIAIAEARRGDACQIMAAALDDLGAGMPDVSSLLGRCREDAVWWADFATPQEVETVVAAGLRQIGKTAFGIKARKRLIVMLWQSLGDADRRAFLQGVDPSGKFRGRGA